jgi:uncharacterized protein YndB with AHSA1/START domain
MSDARTEVMDPIVKTVVVPLGAREAFDLFTSGIATWWPLPTHSVGGEEAVTCRFESGVGGRIVEVEEDGTEHVWGTVQHWQPPRRVVFSWHPSRDASTAQEVQVRFEPAPEGTAVELEHRNWEVLGDAAWEIRTHYVTGWDVTLNRFVEGAGRG